MTARIARSVIAEDETDIRNNLLLMLRMEGYDAHAASNGREALDLLRRFKDMGVTLAIDDFGTAYCSLAYLKRFPLDVLKIDQSFVRQLTSDREDQAIANAVIQLAHSLGQKMIAEGVETPEQQALLRDMGCDQVQGYLHAKPMPAAEAAA
jgi:EAL domain-containing protein (putative c-di-GMP-specific phosphodiesterase class I)